MGLRIAFLLPSLAKTAPIIIAANIIKHIKNECDVVAVFYLKNEIGIDIEVPAHRLDFSVPFSFENFDVLHTHMLKPDLYVRQHRKHIKCKTITTLHSFIHFDIFNNYTFPKNLIATMAWHRALWHHDAMVCLTNTMKKYYQARYPMKKIFVANNGLDIPKLTEELTPEEEQEFFEIKKKYQVIGTTSLLTKLKGLEIIIPFLQGNKNYFWYAAGSGKRLESLKRKAIKAGVIDRCLFAGFKKNSLALYSHFDIFAFPSRSEGFGLSMAEAALYKCPIVCSNIEVFRELFTDQEVSFFNLDDINSFCDAVTKLEQNPVSYGVKVHKRMQQCYTASHMAQTYLNIYKETIQ